MNNERRVQNAEGHIWSRMRPGDVLPNLEISPARQTVDSITGNDGTYVVAGDNIPGDKRCHAIGLRVSDCSQRALAGSKYCYYHDKVRTGLVEGHTDITSGNAIREVPPTYFYPAWPLPEEGYLLLLEEAA